MPINSAFSEDFRLVPTPQSLSLRDNTFAGTPVVGPALSFAPQNQFGGLLTAAQFTPTVLELALYGAQHLKARS